MQQKIMNTLWCLMKFTVIVANHNVCYVGKTVKNFYNLKSELSHKKENFHQICWTKLNIVYHRFMFIGARKLAARLIIFGLLLQITIKIISEHQYIVIIYIL